MTDSLFMLIDRLTIARLKAFYFKEAGNEAAAEMAREQAEELALASELLLREYLSGERRIRVTVPPRFHDHRIVEGKWAYHKADMPEPKSIMECAGALAETHARYWSLQTEVQALKRLIDASQGLPDLPAFESRFVVKQRQIDLCNQIRSDLVALGDTMLKEAMDETREE